jgi:hypothetical protein
MTNAIVALLSDPADWLGPLLHLTVQRDRRPESATGSLPRDVLLVPKMKFLAKIFTL